MCKECDVLKRAWTEAQREVYKLRLLGMSSTLLMIGSQVILLAAIGCYLIDANKYSTLTMIVYAALMMLAGLIFENIRLQRMVQHGVDAVKSLTKVLMSAMTPQQKPAEQPEQVALN